MSKIDHIEEIEKTSRYDQLQEVEKFNPYHDSRGRFSSSNGYASFTYKPGQGKMYDLAIQREKDRAAAEAAKPVDTTKPPAGTKTQTDHPPGKKLVDDDATDFIAKQTGASKKEAEAMAEAIHDFTGSEYKEIRKAGFKGSPPGKAEAKEKADLIDKAIEAAPKFDGEVFRGIGTTPQTARQIVDQARDGHLVSQMGAASFSTKESVARNFAIIENEGAMVVFVSKGVQNGTSIRPISRYTGENEVLMSSKAMWKPTGKVTEEEVDTWQGKVKLYKIETEPFWGDAEAYESTIEATPLF